MSDPIDRSVRELAHALVRNAPTPPQLDLDSPYVDASRPRPGPTRRRVLVGCAVGALLIAGGVTFSTGRSPETPNEIAANAQVSKTATAPPLLAGHYQLFRSSWENGSINKIIQIRKDEIPANPIDLERALAAVPPPDPQCAAPAPAQQCDPPFSTGRLARYRGLAGNPPDNTHAATNNTPSDLVVWVLVRDDANFASAQVPGNPIVRTVLVDAVTGEYVTSGALQPST